MEMLSQLFFSGIITGVIYGLIALGFVLIYKSSGVLNMAQGELVMIGAYVFYTGMEFIGLPVWLSFIFTFIMSAIYGMVINRISIRPLIGQPLLSIIMMTIVLSIGLRGIAILAWQAEIWGIGDILGTGTFNFLSAVFSVQSIWGFALALLGMIVFWLYFQRTKGGLAMRAIAEDHQSARGVGVNINAIFGMAWIIAAIVGALGGILLATTAGVSTDLSYLGLKVLPVVLLGGLDSIPGALVGGVIVGIAENMAVGYLDPIITEWGIVGGGLRGVFPYVIAIVILIFKPYGLFGQKRIERI